MTIECYLDTCPKHSKDEPFCFEPDCVASVAELLSYHAVLEVQRAEIERDEEKQVLTPS